MIGRVGAFSSRTRTRIGRSPGKGDAVVTADQQALAGQQRNKPCAEFFGLFHVSPFGTVRVLPREVVDQDGATLDDAIMDSGERGDLDIRKRCVHVNEAQSFRSNLIKRPRRKANDRLRPVVAAGPGSRRRLAEGREGVSGVGADGSMSSETGVGARSSTPAALKIGCPAPERLYCHLSHGFKSRLRLHFHALYRPSGRRCAYR
jgi:hypothetical protein